MSAKDVAAAFAFWKLVEHLQVRVDVQNIEQMILAGFCRNCLGDWISEASRGAISREAAREAVHGMPAAEWKARHQSPATPEQLARMEASLALNAKLRGEA